VNASGVAHLRSRLISALSRGQTPGAEAGVGKLVLATWLQEMAATGMDLLGPAGALAGADASPVLAEIQESYFLAAGYRLGGGSDEILRNTIGERVLGLPPDVRTDKDVPFNQLRSRAG
jgi:alkylation response protein AidB-like acyl-CoA dehydrogenase